MSNMCLDIKSTAVEYNKIMIYNGFTVFVGSSMVRPAIHKVVYMCVKDIYMYFDKYEE